MLVGPTASGKTELALRLATELDCAILSIDSMQVYRGLDIGTAKPTREEQARIRHYMVDVVEPGEAYTVAMFQAEARRALADEHRRMIITGGSGLHMRAVLDPLTFPPHDEQVRADVAALAPGEQLAELLAEDPAAGEVIDVANPRRVERAVEILRLTGATPTERASAEDAQRVSAYEPHIPFFGFGIDPGDGLAERVRRRVDAMIEQGLLEEVARVELGATARQAVGYKELLPVVQGTSSAAAGIEAVERATLALAKRQRTFFRRDPRIRWLTWSDDPDQRYASLRREIDRVLA